jgi:hypothetical protein
LEVPYDILSPIGKAIRYKKQKAQVIVEYLLFIAVALGVLYVFLSRGGYFERGVRNMIKTTGNYVIESGNKMFF